MSQSDQDPIMVFQLNAQLEDIPLSAAAGVRNSGNQPYRVLPTVNLGYNERKIPYRGFVKNQVFVKSR